MPRVNIKHPTSFKEGVRVLLLMLRAKDGGHARTDRKAVQKIITRTPAEFDTNLADFISRAQGEERVYSTINPRDVDKAARLFQYRILDANYFATQDRRSFYLDLDNRWISCLKDGKASAEQYFLVDVDDISTLGSIHDQINEHKLITLDEYHTRQGVHIILKPFNPSLVTFPVMKNALMLWSY